MALWTVPRIWEGGECWIIGGGTSVPRQFNVPEDIIRDVMAGKQPASAYSPYLAPIHDRHVIAINNAFKIGNWIDALFFGDCAWYNVYRLMLAPLQMLKVTCCTRFAKAEKLCEGIKYLERDRDHTSGISPNPTKVAWNGNSGAAAISLARHFGVKRIILLGFDMALDASRVSHWHGSHHPQKSPRKVTPPPFDRHLRGFPLIASDAKAMGIEILNASPISAITVFPKVSVWEVLSDGKGSDTGAQATEVDSLGSSIPGGGDNRTADQGHQDACT